jgi:hypothetical protein
MRDVYESIQDVWGEKMNDAALIRNDFYIIHCFLFFYTVARFLCSQLARPSRQANRTQSQGQSGIVLGRIQEWDEQHQAIGATGKLSTRIVCTLCRRTSHHDESAQE